MATDPRLPVFCPECQSANSRFDRFCGACGVQLARLRWRPASGGLWQEGDGRLAITAGANAYLLFANNGVTPVTLLLDESQLDRLPDWVAVGALRGKPIHLSPGALESIEIELRHHVVADSQDQLTFPDAELAFHSSAGTHQLRLTLVLTRQPWVQPKASRYLYLPYEQLRHGLTHEIEIHNAAAGSIELLGISLLDGEAPSHPADARPIPAASLLGWDPLEASLPIAAGQVWQHEIRLQLAEPPDTTAVFGARIVYRLKVQDEEVEVESRLEGILGRGPSLEFQGGATIDRSAPGRESQDFFNIRNPGHVAVEIKAFEVFGRAREAVADSENDWLVLAGLGPGDLLQPGEERSLQVGYRPDARQPRELQEALNKRVVRIRHDGWQSENERFVEGEVFAHFGRAEERTLGIDFGTSNSVACLVGEVTDEGYPLVLDVCEGEKSTEYLPSLMFFDGRKSAKTELDRFLYGEEARSSQSMEPANLVRSIKTVVADGSKDSYEFKIKGGDGSPRYLELPVQKLLNAFIRHLRTKAEEGALELDPDILYEEELNEKRVVFRNAVFSHPVEVTESMKTALWHAAQKAGINTNIRTIEEFFENCCIDEATAAVLAFVDRLLADFKAGRSERELKDLERILCVDIGGGTTDIAAVTVINLGTFAKNPAGKVQVELWNRKGDRHFAGDALDRLLAGRILAHIEEQSRKTGFPILVNEVQWAIQATSYSSYQRTFEERLRNNPRLRTILDTTDAYAIYRHAANLLEEAEKAKRWFSTEETWTQTFSGARWPRKSGADAAVDAAELEVRLDRADFEKIVREALQERFHLLDAVVKGALWEWPAVSTLLLTGQSMLSPIIRKPIRDYVRKQVGEAAESLFVAEPRDGGGTDGGGLNPKTCVAIGAALWGISRHRGGAWLDIRKPLLEKLTFDLTTKRGRFFVPVAGLEVGASLPARGELPFELPRQKLVLYRDQKKFAEFRNFKMSTSVKIVVQSLVEVFVEVDGEQFPGEIHR